MCSVGFQTGFKYMFQYDFISNSIEHLALHFAGMCFGGLGEVFGTFLEDVREGFWDMFGRFFGGGWLEG